MIGLGPLLRKELLEAWRTRRMLVVAIVFTAFGIGSRPSWPDTSPSWSRPWPAARSRS